MGFYKFEAFALGFVDVGGLTAGEAVFGVGDGMELECDMVFFELFGHKRGLFVGDIGVGGAVDEDGGR